MNLNAYVLPTYIGRYYKTSAHLNRDCKNNDEKLQKTALGIKFHPWVQNFILGYKISSLGTKFHPWVQNFTPGYINLSLGTQFHPWVQNFTLEYKSSPLGTKFHP
jgi:hypothetical protein